MSRRVSADGMRDESDFYDEQPEYHCSCGGFKMLIDSCFIPQQCPRCGAPVEIED